MVDGRNGRRDCAPRQTRCRMVDGRSVRMVGARTHVDRRRRCRPAACVASHPGTDAELSRPQSRGGTAAMAHAVGMPNGRWARTGDGLMVCRAPQRPGRPLRRVWRFAPRARRVWRAREVRASRRRKGVKARPNTCSTSPRSIRAAQRRAEALDLRVQGHPYSVIGRHLGVSTALCVMTRRTVFVATTSPLQAFA